MAQQVVAVHDTIDQILDSYRLFLRRNKYTGHLERFEDRTDSDRTAAVGEAAIFMMLWNQKLHPDVNEDLAKGGPDFLCSPRALKPFLVEVTSLASESLSDKSTLPREIEGPGGQAYGLVTEKLRGVVKGKVSQLGNQAHPSVLAITSCYDYAGLLLDHNAAHNLLISDPWFSIPIGGPRDAGNWQTDFKKSAFCFGGLLDAQGNPIVTVSGKSVSAVLLATIHGGGVDVVGLLHPDPVRPFDPSSLPTVPFIRLHWPIVAGRVSTEWIQRGSAYASFPHKYIR